MSLFDQIGNAFSSTISDIWKQVPSDARAIFKQVAGYIEEGNYQQAEEQLKVVLKRYPTLPQTYKLLGEVYRQQGRHEEALRAYDDALARGDTVELRVNAAEEAIESDIIAEAMQHLRVLEQQDKGESTDDPANPFLYRYYLAATANYRGDNLDAALYYIDEFIKKTNYKSLSKTSVKSDSYVASENENVSLTNDSRIQNERYEDEKVSSKSDVFSDIDSSNKKDKEDEVTIEEIELRKRKKEFRRRAIELKLTILDKLKKYDIALDILANNEELFKNDLSKDERKYKIICGFANQLEKVKGNRNDILNSTILNFLNPPINVFLPSTVAAALAKIHLVLNNVEKSIEYLNAVRGGLWEHQRYVYDQVLLRANYLLEASVSDHVELQKLTPKIISAARRLIDYEFVDLNDFGWVLMIGVRQYKTLILTLDSDKIQENQQLKEVKDLIVTSLAKVASALTSEKEKEVVALVQWYVQRLIGEIKEDDVEINFSELRNQYIKYRTHYNLVCNGSICNNDLIDIFLYKVCKWRYYIQAIKYFENNSNTMGKFKFLLSFMIDNLVSKSQKSNKKIENNDIGIKNIIIPKENLCKKDDASFPLSVQKWSELMLIPILDEAKNTNDIAQKAFLESLIEIKNNRKCNDFNSLNIEPKTRDLVNFQVHVANLIAKLPPLTKPYAQFVTTLATAYKSMYAPLQIGIVGEFNAGKSSLINALMRETLLPTGVLPTTAHLVTIKWGLFRTARMTLADGQTGQVPLDELAAAITNNDADLRKLEIELPHPLLREFEFVDSPGFNAIEERHEALASSVLNTCDAVLWVMDANQALSSSELAHIRSVRATTQRLYIVLNKIDRIWSDKGEVDGSEDLQTVKKFVSDQLGATTSGVFALSTKWALENNDDEHFKKFWNSFSEQVLDKISSLKREQFEGQISQFKSLVDQVVFDEISNLFSNSFSEVGNIGNEQLENGYKALLETAFSTLNEGKKLQLEDVKSEKNQVVSDDLAKEINKLPQVPFLVLDTVQFLIFQFQKQLSKEVEFLYDSEAIIDIINRLIPPFLERLRSTLKHQISATKEEILHHIQKYLCVNSFEGVEKNNFAEITSSFFDSTTIILAIDKPFYDILDAQVSVVEKLFAEKVVSWREKSAGELKESFDLFSEEVGQAMRPIVKFYSDSLEGLHAAVEQQRRAMLLWGSAEKILVAVGYYSEWRSSSSIL